MKKQEDLVSLEGEKPRNDWKDGEGNKNMQIPSAVNK